jgi:hypothetical protein
LTEGSGSYLLALPYWRSLRGRRMPETQMNLEKAPKRKAKAVKGLVLILKKQAYFMVKELWNFLTRWNCEQYYLKTEKSKQ